MKRKTKVSKGEPPDVREPTRVVENVYEIPRAGAMRVPARLYASERLLDEMRTPGDQTLQQIANVATLPGTERFAVCLPDAHQGYGFPIGGVAAVDAEEGVISPGGIGFDINCGVRLLRTNLTSADVAGHEEDLAVRLYSKVPTGTGKGGYLTLGRPDLEAILADGMEWMLRQGYAVEADLEHCEEGGRLPGDPDAVSDRAKERGLRQLGSLGSGNHFIEVQRVVDVYDERAAEAFGLRTDGIVVMVHSGSRGLGHQVCTDYLRQFERTYPDVVASLPDRQLVYAPMSDPLAQRYRGAMYAAANFAWANRQGLTLAVRHAFREVFGESVAVDLVYDVCHNVAKEERHEVGVDSTGRPVGDDEAVDRAERRLLVHRKGATRAFPAGHPDVPADYRDVGQPVIVPGSMGTASYVLAGGASSMDLTFGSTAHGAGRVKSRTQAKKEYRAGDLQQSLRAQGIYVRARSGATVAEEAPGAYKDVDEVVRVSDALGIGTKVARMRPVANVKG